MTFVPGAIVKMTSDAPRVYNNVRELTGRVENVFGNAFIMLADVNFDLGDGYETADALQVKGIQLRYLKGAAGGRRRGVLNLHEPKDTRTEKKKQAEAEAWLLPRGYEVLGIGQYHRAAVCWNCTRAVRQENPNARPVTVLCKGCGKPAFSGDSGNTEGAADWFLRRIAVWPANLCMGIEWKRDAKAKRRPEQILLEQKGWHVIVDSKAACCRAIADFERALGIEPHPDIEDMGH